MLVLSLFPGIGMLDKGFEDEGFCVVRGPDLLWGGDIRSFHPPSGVFDGVIGGPPCQAFSTLANLVRAKGLEPRFGNLIPEFARCVEEAESAWFLMENVPQAPDPEPAGHGVTSFLLNNCWLGEAQMRKRRFWFGMRRREAPNLRRWIPGVALELPETAQAVTHALPAVPVRIGGKVKTTAVGGNDGICKSGQLTKTTAVLGRNEGRLGRPERDYSPPRRSLEEMLELQGLPSDWLNHQPWTMQAKRRMVGNGVPIPMARAVARAVRRALA